MNKQLFDINSESLFEKATFRLFKFFLKIISCTVDVSELEIDMGAEA